MIGIVCVSILAMTIRIGFFVIPNHQEVEALMVKTFGESEKA